MLSSSISGRRREIVLVDGFRFGSATWLAFVQSTYSQESFFSQKLRSSASVLNVGVALRGLLINCPLFTVHVSGGDHADERITCSQRKSNMQGPACACFAKSVVSGFALAMLLVGNDKERGIEKGFLCLELANAVLKAALMGVMFIPLEA